MRVAALKLVLTLALTAALAAGCAGAEKTPGPDDTSHMAAANPFAASYRDLLASLSVEDRGRLAPFSGEPAVIPGGDSYDRDNLKMIEDGYYPIGISQFSGQKGDPKDAVSHGVSLHAAAVVLYDRSDGAAASDARCVATYWQKTKPPMLGLAVLDMPTETQRKAGRRAGAVVAVVVRNSPAFYAGLAQGDIITRIGNHEVLNAEDFRSAYPAFAGRETEIRFLRNNRKNSVKVNFGTE